MKNLTIYLFLFLAVAACKSNLEKVEMMDEDGYKIEYTRAKKTFAKEGLLKKYYKEGGVFEEANYSNDVLNGERKMYYPNGKVQIVETYKEGSFDGPYKVYYDNGQVQLEGDYLNNNMEGSWTGYYNTGELKEKVTFKGSEENGPFIEYYKNGNLKAEGNYLEGDNEDGLLKMYDEAGTLTKKMDCKKGICRTIWTLEGGDVSPK